MSYPKEMNMKLSKLANFQSQLIKLTGNVDKITSSGNDRVIFKLPANSLVALKSFSVFGQGTTAEIQRNNTPDSYKFGYFPRNSESMIRSVAVKANSQEIDRIDNFNQIFNIVSDYDYKETSSVQSMDDPSTFSTMDGSGNITVVNAGDQHGSANNYLNAVEMSFTRWLGFLQDVKYIDTRLTGSIEIELRFENANALFTSSNVAGTALPSVPAYYEINNIYATIVRLQMDKTYYDIIDSEVNNSGMKLHFKSYTSHQGPLGPMTQSFSFNVVSSSLRKIYATLLEDDYATNTLIQNGTPADPFVAQLASNSEDLFNQSRYFKKDGVGLSSSQVEINNVQLTNPLTPAEVFENNKDALNMRTTDKKMFSGCKSLNAWQKYWYAHIQSLNLDDPEKSHYISGLDSMNSSIAIVYKTTGTGAQVYPLAFCEIDKIVNINSGQSITVEV